MRKCVVFGHSDCMVNAEVEMAFLEVSNYFNISNFPYNTEFFLLPF